MVSYVKPLGLPTLIGGGSRDLEIFPAPVFAKLEAGSAYYARAFGVRLGLEKEKVTKEIEMWLDAKICFAKVYEDGDLKNGIGVKIAKGNPVEDEKTPEKGMNRKT